MNETVEVTEQTISHDTADNAVFVPANLLFRKIVELPSPLNGSELDAFVTLSLEEHSPFPVEQLAWGYFRDADRLLVFAMAKAQLPPAILDEWDNASHLYPAFLPLLLLERPTSQALGLYHDGTVSLFQFQDNQAVIPLPGTRHRRADNTQAIADALSELSAEAGLSEPAPLYTIKGCEVGEDGQASFYVQKDGTDQAVVRPTLDNAWNADLRDRDFLVKQRRQLRLQRYLWRGLLGGLAAILLLGLISLSAFVLAQINARNSTVIAEQQSRVEAITNNSVQIDRLQNFIDEPFRPFDPLEEMERLRPKRTIYFTDATVSEDNSVRIRGFANQVNTVNNYLSQLFESGHFTQQRQPDYRSRDGKSRFDLRLIYRPEARLADASADTRLVAEARSETDEEEAN